MYCQWPLARALGYGLGLRKGDLGRKVPDDVTTVLFPGSLARRAI